MSFRVIAKGHRFAIDGELNAAVRRERESLGRSGSGGAPASRRMLDTLHTAVEEVIRHAPHECDIEVDLWGTREADGTGAFKAEVKITLPTVAEPVTAKEALLEEEDDEK